MTHANEMCLYRRAADGLPRCSDHALGDDMGIDEPRGLRCADCDALLVACRECVAPVSVPCVDVAVPGPRWVWGGDPDWPGVGVNHLSRMVRGRFERVAGRHPEEGAGA